MIRLRFHINHLCDFLVLESCTPVPIAPMNPQIVKIYWTNKDVPEKEPLSTPFKPTPRTPILPTRDIIIRFPDGTSQPPNTNIYNYEKLIKN